MIMGKLLEDNTLEKGGENEYTSIDSIENEEPMSCFYKKADTPFAIGTLVGNIRSFHYKT